MAYLRIFLLLLITLPAGAASKMDLDIFSLPEGLAEVRTFGKWQESGIDGMYRVLVVRNEGLRSTHSVYVQWICDCKSGRLASLPVTQVNDQQYVVSDLEVREKEGLYFIQFKSMNARTKEQQIMQVQFTKLGEYRFAAKKVYSQPSYYQAK